MINNGKYLCALYTSIAALCIDMSYGNQTSTPAT